MQFRYSTSVLALSSLFFIIVVIVIIISIITEIVHIFMSKHLYKIDLFCVGAGGYGHPLSAGRGTPTQPPSPFNAFLVTTPAGGFAAPQAYPQQGYSTAPQFGQ